MNNYFDRRLLDEERRLAKLLESLGGKNDSGAPRPQFKVGGDRRGLAKSHKSVQTDTCIHPRREKGTANHVPWDDILMEQELIDLRLVVQEQESIIVRLEQDLEMERSKSSPLSNLSSELDLLADMLQNAGVPESVYRAQIDKMKLAR